MIQIAFETPNDKEQFKNSVRDMAHVCHLCKALEIKCMCGMCKKPTCKAGGKCKKDCAEHIVKEIEEQRRR